MQTCTKDDILQYYVLYAYGYKHPPLRDSVINARMNFILYEYNDVYTYIPI